MAVTKATFTASPTWTAAQLATALESALVGSGIMAAWHASFASGSVENRVLEVTYGAGTYGKTYYWFKITTSGVFVAVASGFNNGTNLPTGTTTTDFVSNVTNATTGHVQLISAVNTTSLTVTHYTAGNYTVILFRQSTTYRALMLHKAGVVFQGWADLTRTCHTGLLTFSFGQVGTSNTLAYILGTAPASIGRSMDNPGTNNSAEHGMNMYVVGQNHQNTFGGLYLPRYDPAVNPAFSSAVMPVWTGLQFFASLNERIHPDFGIAQTISNTNAIQDTLTVSGSEIYEIIGFGNVGGGTATDASIVMVARTT